MRFDPKPNDSFQIGRDTFKVTPHPQVPYMAFGQEGRKSVVYQLQRTSDSKLYALKVFKPAFRGPYVVEVAHRIARYAALPGMAACERTALTKDKHLSLITQYPELEYAVLMPWVADQTWHDIIVSNYPLSRERSLKLTRSAADILSRLEIEGLAHCDIAGGNVLINADRCGVNLIDLEDMYGIEVPPPGAFPAGTAGYQHRTGRTSQQGQWCVEGDRFSGAIILAEMLAWHNPRIQAKSYGEHYFAEDELQDPGCERYKLMLEVLGDISEDIAGLFAKAWSSPTLAHCPTLNKWAHVIAAVTPPPRAETKPRPDERRRRRVLLGSGAAALCLIASLCAGFLLVADENVGGTPAPLAIATPIPFTEAASFFDGFSDPASGWPTFTDDEISKRYENGQFVIDVNIENTLAWATLEQEYEDVDFEVETVKLAGSDDNCFGLLLRYQDSDNFYLFEISSGGSYHVSLLRGDEWRTLIKWTETKQINPDGTNTIAVKARGNQFTLFINGAPVDQVYDDTFSQGKIGLVAGAFSEPPVSIGFDNVRLHGPGGSREVTVVSQSDLVSDSELVYSDDFSKEAGWHAHEATHSRSFYDHGEYYVEVLESDIIMHFPSSDSWPDVIIDVDARQVGGSEYGLYGLDCRYQDQDNFYELAIRADGYYRILVRQGGEYSILRDWTATNAIYQGQASNHLTAICEGDRLALRVNGEFVTEVFDDSLSEGRIALVAGSFEKPNVLVAFDNLRVSVPVTAQATAAATKASTPVTTVEDEWGVVTIKKGDPIKLGFAAGLSGAGIDVLGLDEQRGAELAVKDKPKVLGFVVKLQVEDSQCNAEGGRTAATKFVADPQIVAVVGHMCSSSCTPAAAIYEQNGYTMVSPSCVAPSLTAPDTGTKAFNRVCWNDKIQGPATAKFVYETLGMSEAATIHDGSPYAEQLGQEFAKGFEALGGKIVAAEAVHVGDTDMRPVLTRIKAAEPELIYFSGFIAEGGYLVSQMADVGMADVIFIGGDGIKADEFIMAAGDAAEGVYASAVDFAEAGPDLKFLEAYEAEYGEEPIAPFHAHAYDATMVILNAIEKVGLVDADGNLLIGRKALNEAIRGTKGYRGLTGTIICDEYGDCGTGSVDIFVVKNGEWILVE